jgi:hypothetical protein
MTSFLGHCRILLFAATVLAFLLISPASANASCGDYARVRGETDAHAEEASSHPDPTLPSPPCHGPNCSRAPQTPPTPASSPVPSVAEDDWGRAEEFVALAVIHTSTTVRDSDEGKGIPRTSDIFHPPR